MSDDFMPGAMRRVRLPEGAPKFTESQCDWQRDRIDSAWAAGYLLLTPEQVSRLLRVLYPWDYESDECPEPTSAVPGTGRKVAAMLARASARYDLFHAHDSELNDRQARRARMTLQGAAYAGDVLEAAPGGRLEVAERSEEIPVARGDGPPLPSRRGAGGGHAAGSGRNGYTPCRRKKKAAAELPAAAV